MIRRLATHRLRELARRFPIACVLGARQVGKTTLARQTFPSATYFDLERPADLGRLQIDPELAIERSTPPVILDEAQAWPPIFPIVRSMVDRAPHLRGRFVVVGSAQPILVRGVSESLAGRVGFVELDPLCAVETARGAPRASVDQLWLAGGYPGGLRARGANARRDWMEGYTRTFIERDLAALGLDLSGARMRRLWGMLAHLHGGLFNASELGASLGTSYHTVQRYLDVLEQSFLVRRLLPYHANVGKRLTRAPRVYVRDSGVLHHFLGITSSAQLDVAPRRGASWEGFVIEQIIRRERLANPDSQFWFWRTAAGAEVDLLVDRAGQILPIEIKLARQIGREDLRGLQGCMSDLRLPRGIVLAEVNAAFEATAGIEVRPTRAVVSSSRWSL